MSSREKSFRATGSRRADSIPFCHSLAVQGFVTAPQSATAGLAPALMTFLLVKVSGVAMLDAHMAATRPEHADHIRRTPRSCRGRRRPDATRPTTACTMATCRTR